MSVVIDPMINENPAPMFRDFAQTVCQMRAAQKRYFKTRDKDALIESKKLESAVDMRLGLMKISVIS